MVGALDSVAAWKSKSLQEAAVLQENQATNIIMPKMERLMCLAIPVLYNGNVQWRFQRGNLHSPFAPLAAAGTFAWKLSSRCTRVVCCRVRMAVVCTEFTVISTTTASQAWNGGAIATTAFQTWGAPDPTTLNAMLADGCSWHDGGSNLAPGVMRLVDFVAFAMRNPGSYSLSTSIAPSLTDATAFAKLLRSASEVKHRHKDMAILRAMNDFALRNAVGDDEKQLKAFRVYFEQA